MPDRVFEMQFAELETLKIGDWLDRIKEAIRKIGAELGGYELESVTLTISASPSAAIKFSKKKPGPNRKKR